MRIRVRSTIELGRYYDLADKNEMGFEMRALEFEGHVANRDQIQLPPNLAAQIPEGSAVRVILLFENTEGETRSNLGLDRFVAAYSDEDAVYERLDGDLALR